MVLGNNEYVAALSLITLHGDNIKDSDQQDIVTNVNFEAILPSIKLYVFHQGMVDFANKLDLSEKKYQTMEI